MVTTIILSKDRPAQLDLLLRSLDRNGGGWFGVPFVAVKGYGYEAQGWAADMEEETDLSSWVEDCLARAEEFVCFMCDDGLLYRPRPFEAIVPLRSEVLCFSLRLGLNTTVCYPSGLTQKVPPVSPWPWVGEPTEPGLSDFGYPGSVDGHVFRTADVVEMLAGRSFPNPTALECALVEGCTELADKRPLMACYPHSVYVGIPVNRVSEQSGVRYGTEFPLDQAEATKRFLAGDRLDLDAAIVEAETRVNGAHTELPLTWQNETSRK